MTNLSKLQEAYSLLGILESDEQVAPMIKEIKRHIHEFMVDNEPAPKKGEFNLWDFVSNDPIRPTMCGVFHDKENGMAVASDCHILVADKASYDESKVEPNGKMWPIDKYGKFIEGLYPSWNKIIPEKDSAIEKGYKQYHVDAKDVEAYIKECKAYMKLNEFVGKHAMRPVFNIPNTNSWFRADYLLKFLLASGGDVWLINGDASRPAIYWSDERKVLLMPVLVDNVENITYGDNLYMLD
jgi:hypothetical protein